MNDNRMPLSKNEPLFLGAETYTILETIGCGANAIVYKAAYKDGLLREKEHTVLIKELFPLHKEGLIYRDESKNIVFDEKAADYFELHKKSFLRGNMAHLDLQAVRADKSTTNINSFEARGTLYTILGYSNGQTLKDAVQNGALRSLADITACMLNVLDALQVFHKNGLLHLDISPDNVLLMPIDDGKPERFRNVLLIDYNSVWAMEELTNHSGLYYSIKEPYSAPEIILHDYASVGPAADIFSVCAMFTEYIQGKPLELAALTSGNAKIVDSKAEILKNCPATVVHKAVSIIRRGLKLPPKQRHQSIEELSQDLEELLNRINGVGITHSALWEVSAINCRNTMESNPAFSYLNENPISNENTLAAMKENQHNVIIGGGGMGKTTTLLTVWKEGIRSYNPKEPVPVYIPLYHYKSGTIPFIKGALLEKLKLDRATSTVNDALHALKHLLDTPIETQKGPRPSVLLLLDGLNEVNGPVRPLLLEIEELSKQKGVGIILTSRTNNVSASFHHVNLSPLEDTDIRKYLADNEVLYPDDTSLLTLLENPMMLSLYVRICKVRQSNVNIQTKEELITAYLDSLLLSHKDKTAGSENEQIQAKFAIDILLPFIAGHMSAGQKHALTPQETYQAVQKCYRELNKKSFIITFPEYIGKTKAILGGAKNAEEWFDYTIYTILKNKFALLWQDENKNYCLLHEDFRDYLNGVYKRNNARLRKIKAKRSIPYVAAAILITIVLVSSAVKLIRQFPSQYPKTAEETNTVKMAMNGLVYTTGLLDRQLTAESKILKNINDKTLQGDETAFQSWKSFKELELKAVDAQDYNEDETDLLIEYLTNPRNTIPLDVLKELYGLPEAHRAQLDDMMDTLTDYLSPDSVYPPEDKKQIIELYEKRLDNYTTETFIKLQQALEPLTDDARSPILDFLPYTNVLKGKFVNINWSDKNYKAQLEICRTNENDLVWQMKELGFSAQSGEGKTAGIAVASEMQDAGSIDGMLLELEEILAVVDNRTWYYENALNAASQYLDRPTDDNLQAARSVCTDSIKSILSLEVVTTALDEKTKNEMVSLGIDIIDYRALFGGQAQYKALHIRTIMSIIYYLNNAPDMNVNLDNLLELELRTETAFRQIDYIGINHLLANVPDDDLGDFISVFLPGLQAFSADQLPWEKNKTVLEAKAEALFLDAENAIGEFAGFIGEEYANLLTTQKEQENVLISNGLTANEAKEILDGINQLAEQSAMEQLNWETSVE